MQEPRISRYVMAPTTRNTGRALLEPDSNQSQEVNMNAAAIVQPLNEPVHHEPAISLNCLCQYVSFFFSCCFKYTNSLSCHQLKTGIEEIAGSRKKAKRARGPTFMCKVWGQHNNECVQVFFNDKGQPISNYSTLSHFLGTIARNGKYAPLQYKTWHKMPKVFKEDMFALVLQKFDFSPGHKRWFLKSLSKKWRNWKATMKRDHHDSNLSIEEQIHSPPDRVQADQWKELVKYWHQDAKKFYTKNKSSRAGQNIIYKKGKTPLAIVRETESKNLGHDPSRAHMFLTCFTNDGKVSNEELRKKIVSFASFFHT
ncbi:hypothetical protein RHMOL_Rhmol02G0242500 [Rhododendron molle]|uniref:Uncharacterized protein n=1 Tax=Rhododendron molle TaxID=49168 RepID=A0ACC0PTE2_RHOML|nr:hypothetical protein RHMOL_Rhmol02G0242500 [Rhododendron molle]